MRLSAQKLRAPVVRAGPVPADRRIGLQRVLALRRALAQGVYDADARLDVVIRALLREIHGAGRARRPA